MAKPHTPTAAAAATTTDAPRTGAVTRSAVVGLAVARAGLAHLSHKVHTHARTSALSEAQAQAARTQHEAALGRILFTALNQLKGTALKASQLMSMELGFLPDTLRDELARAHYQVTPLNRALVLKLMRQEFGQSPQTLYPHFDPHAFAAASLGQVHAATLASGEAVAVKLQYPGMAALAELQHWQRLPFTAPVYDFAQHPAPPRMSTHQHQQALQHLHAMPPDMPYFDRSYFGLVQLLKSLGARVNTGNPWVY